MRPAEDELKKETGMNPTLLLTSLQSLREFWPLLSGTSAAEPLHTRLKSLCESTAKRMGDSYRDAVAASQQPKMDALIKFAKAFDEAVNGLEGASGGLEATLTASS